ncbi:MAG TPA: exosortase/archaeosortase family protein [Gemmataceae bacterium]|nr:exosortase/archaeosortase family protein [Gemmataceae bacterium]
MTAQTAAPLRTGTFAVISIAGLLGIAGAWAYWTTLGAITTRWSDDPQYSHGYLVPLFALYLLWLRRDRLQNCRANVLGLGLLAIGIGVRLAGAYLRVEYLDQISLLPAISGLIMLAGGWPAWSWSWPAVAFLAFMVPLPHSISVALSGPMQSFATTVSTFCLQVVGLPAIAEGNVILLNDIELGIVEACSGLRMLVTFFALSTAVAVLIRKPLWEKCLIAGSAVPIALASNVLRITLTGVSYELFGKEIGDQYFHDALGYAMPFMGMVFLFLELWILKTLLIDGPKETAPLPPAQRGDANAVSMYRTGQTSRREKKPAEPAAEPTPEPVEV